MQLKITSKNTAHTKEIANTLAKSINSGKTIAFQGDLGSGKTTFIQGLAQGLEIKEKITSPTFVIFKKYKINNNTNLKWFYHFDLYRIKSIEEVIDLGFEEIVNDKSAIITIEWSEKIKKILPQDHLKIKIKNINKNTRKLLFEDHK